jgi:hypothetical protein
VHALLLAMSATRRLLAHRKRAVHLPGECRLRFSVVRIGPHPT